MAKRLFFMISVCCCVLLQTSGMELALKKHKHNKGVVYSGESDIPFFPLVRSKKLSSVRDIVVKNNSAHEDLLCNIAVLPKELRQDIILKMFDDNFFAAKIFLKTPFLYAMTFYHQDRQLLKEKVFVKKVSLDKLFCWSIDKKKTMIALAASRHPVDLFYEDRVFTLDTLEKIRLLGSQERDDFFAGEEVMVIEPETSWKKYSYIVPCGCAAIGFMSTAIVATTACLAGNCSRFIFVVGSITVTSSFILGVVGAGLVYVHVVKKNIRREII